MVTPVLYQSTDKYKRHSRAICTIQDSPNCLFWCLVKVDNWQWKEGGLDHRWCLLEALNQGAVFNLQHLINLGLCRSHEILIFGCDNEHWSYFVYSIEGQFNGEIYSRLRLKGLSFGGLKNWTNLRISFRIFLRLSTGTLDLQELRQHFNHLQWQCCRKMVYWVRDFEWGIMIEGVLNVGILEPPQWCCILR